MKKLLILVLTNFFILTLILLGKPAKAQTTTITGQFLYGLQLYVLPEKQTTPDYSTAIYSRTIDENDFITSGLYENWLQPRLPDGINGYIYLVDSTHTIGNVYLGGGYLEQGQTLSYPYEPSIEMKHYNAQLITIFILNPVNKGYFESYGGRLDYIVYYENNDGSTPRIKLIDATTNENDYNRVKLAINGYDTGYNAGYSIGYNNGQINGYESGYQDGQNNGYNTGYNQGEYTGYYEGYDIGYQRGLNDASQPQYIEIQDYNQLVNNGDFELSQIWQPTNAVYTINNKVATITPTQQFGGIFQELTKTLVVSHKYLIIASVKKTADNQVIFITAGGQTTLTRITMVYPIDTTSNQWIKMYYIGELPQATQINQLRIFLNSGDLSSFDVKNVMLIDLTQMYGIGNEPTTEQSENIFISSYYPYNESEILNLNYLDGLNDGKAIGFDDGVSYQATQQLTSDGWIKNIFTGIGSFLAIEIIPNVSIGLIVGIPFIITVAWFVLKMARGGSSE